MKIKASEVVIKNPTITGTTEDNSRCRTTHNVEAAVIIRFNDVTTQQFEVIEKKLQKVLNGFYNSIEPFITGFEVED